jgi:hypothetical protein
VEEQGPRSNKTLDTALTPIEQSRWFTEIQTAAQRYINLSLNFSFRNEEDGLRVRRRAPYIDRSCAFVTDEKQTYHMTNTHRTRISTDGMHAVYCIRAFFNTKVGRELGQWKVEAYYPLRVSQAFPEASEISPAPHVVSTEPNRDDLVLGHAFVKKKKTTGKSFSEPRSTLLCCTRYQQRKKKNSQRPPPIRSSS